MTQADALRTAIDTYTYDQTHFNRLLLEEEMMKAQDVVAPYLGTSPDGGPVFKWWETGDDNVHAVWHLIENVQHNFPDLFEA